MKFILSALALFISVFCLLAQPNPINRRAMAIAGLATTSTSNPTNLFPNYYYWWVASDVPVNVTLSNQWADRIQGKLSQNLSGTGNPTNSANGMRYNGGVTPTSVFSTNTSTGGSGFDTAASGVGTMFAIINSDNNATTRWLFSPVAQGNGPQTSSQNLRYFGPINGLYTVCPIPTGTNIDFCAVFTTTNTVWYTNGAVALTNVVAGGVPDSYLQGCFGTRANSQSSGLFYLVEAIWYTNRYFTVTDVQKLHKYGTNLYNYAP